ncbi:MAG TPA: hypothetical protein VGU20_26780 [Stellaceae bacterium]|nr:hypothetical protein [Stellaceae bacterium]
MSLHLLIPSASDLAGWGAVAIASMAFIGLGRLWSAAGALPELALVAGWGVLAFLLTLWSALTPWSMVWPAAALTLLGLAAAPWRSAAFWQAAGRLVALALPLLALLASARPSQPDTFLNLLPNAAYVWDHGTFPADDRPPSHSLLPGAPYNLQLAGFIAALVAERFAANALIAFNLVLQLACALLLARVIAGTDDRTAPPSWGAIALGLLATTALNPGFVPRYHLSSYSEASVTVSLAIALWLAARALERIVAGEEGRAELRLLAPTLAALVNIKQDSIALAGGLAVATLVLALWLAPGGRRATAVRIALAALPAVLLYLVWRWYVLGHFAVGELKLLPPAAWQVASIPAILRSMADTIVEKPYFFLAVALAVGMLVARARRRNLDCAMAVAVLFAAVLALYNGALLFTYVAHFQGEIGAAAHSYFRYNTHLGLALVLALVLMAREIARERRWHLPERSAQSVAALAIIAVLVTPVAFLGYLRFDLEPPQQRAGLFAAEAQRALAGGERLALILPGDNGSLQTMLEGLIRLTPPRYPSAELYTVDMMSSNTLERLAAAGYSRVLLSCVRALNLAPGQIVLLEREEGAWHGTATQSYPPPGSARWSHVVAAAPLCL